MWKLANSEKENAKQKQIKIKKFVLSEPWFTHFFNHFPSFSGKNNNNNNKDHSPVTQYQPNEIFQRPFVFPVKKIREGLFFVQSKQPKPPSSNLDLVFSFFFLFDKQAFYLGKAATTTTTTTKICDLLLSEL